ncbi:MAG TPA: class I SAM-dependent methyltransferase [Steroidobacteraceae bacterium]|nr:class I SAM-dependent methyltransferase [Steroidobacteraceae bacterium]
MSNAELFSTVAREYANFRPGYPPELFAWLARISPSHGAAWDCGCGSGQASVALAGHFSQVYATDVAPEQIDAAKPHPRVRYSVATAERCGLDDHSVDLVTVAQALHWFDVTAFYAEAVRVARPGALLAVWNYPRPQFMDAGLDRRFFAFYSQVVGPYWPPERRHIEAGYRTLPFPFEEIEVPQFGLELSWNLEQVTGYVSSWSATARYRKALEADPVPLLRDSLSAGWPAGGGSVAIRMPIGLRVGYLGSGRGVAPVVR